MAASEEELLNIILFCDIEKGVRDSCLDREPMIGVTDAAIRFLKEMHDNGEVEYTYDG